MDIIELRFGGDEARLSHSLAAYRSRYEVLNETERQSVARAVESATEIALQRPFGIDGLCFEILEGSVSGEADHVVYRIPVAILKRAIYAWKCGEPYVPAAVPDILDDGACVGMPEGY